MRYFAVVACLIWGFAGVVAAQDAAPEPSPPAWHVPDATAEPTPVPSTPPLSNDWAAVRAERDHERLVLSDTWMAYLAADEYKTLQVGRWLGVAAFGLLAAGWGTLAILNANDDGGTTTTLALAAGAALSLGVATTLVFTSNPYAARSVTAWGNIAQASLIAVEVTLAAANGDCSGLCRDFRGVAAALSIAQAVEYLLVELLLPPVYVSTHFATYQRLAPDSRPQYALDLLRAREARARGVSYTQLGMSATIAIATGAASLESDSRDVRVWGTTAAGVLLALAIGGFISDALTTTPSERVLAGEGPPKPEGF